MSKKTNKKGAARSPHSAKKPEYGYNLFSKADRAALDALTQSLGEKGFDPVRNTLSESEIAVKVPTGTRGPSIVRMKETEQEQRKREKQKKLGTYNFIRQQKRKYAAKNKKQAGKTWGGETVLTDWQVEHILNKAIDECVHAFVELSKGGDYYEEHNPQHTAYSRIKAEVLRKELTNAISKNGRYRTAYRIESVAGAFYEKEEEYIYNPYEEIYGDAYSFIFTVLYTAITGEDIGETKGYMKQTGDLLLSNLEAEDFID